MNINIKHQQQHPQQQRYTNENVFTKREHILLTHIRTPTVPKVNHVLHRKHSYHRHLQHIYLTESNALLSSNSFSSKKGSIRVLPQCKSEINIINNAKYVHRNNNNNQHEPLRNCINKIREITLIRNSTETKKQRVVCLKQTYDNEINGLNDMMSSLNASNVLFTETFAVKFNEHVKQLRYQAENEKRKLHSLIHTVMTCKHSIKQLEAQIKQIEADKTNVLKWLCLQIKVKERKLTLPSHYTTILEHNNINNSVNAVVNVSSSNNRNGIRKNTRKLHTIQQLIPLNEIERICNYKEHLIYQTADAFIKQLHHIENDNITKLETYNALLNELQLLRNERNELCMQIKLHYTNTQHEVDAKVKEVTKLKLKHAKLLQYMDELSIVSGNNSKCLLDMKCMSKRSKLFKKVVELYNTTLSVRSNTMIHCCAVKKKGNEMLMMLKYVEIAVDGLFAVVNYYNSNEEVYYGRLKQIKNKIEMKHKIEHALHQKEVDKEKWLRLQERIQERNNKVYYKQYRKGNDYYKWLMKNTKRKMISEEHVPQPSFQEFMYDVIDDNN